jgi:hypothetical protein
MAESLSSNETGKLAAVDGFLLLGTDCGATTVCPDGIGCSALSLVIPTPINWTCGEFPFQTTGTIPAGTYAMTLSGGEWRVTLGDCVIFSVTCSPETAIEGQTGTGITWVLAGGDDFDTYVNRYSIARGLACPPSGDAAYGHGAATGANDAYVI